ncbi:MAG: hypothetical protein FWD82_00935 [Defluviitaleaceae bacterium]|nr:hypothetical protein [Defluviitaleaceae bacterium]
MAKIGLITFSGIDGSGKTTQLNMLKQLLQDLNYNIYPQSTIYSYPWELSKSIYPYGLSLYEHINEIVFSSAMDNLKKLLTIKSLQTEDLALLFDRYYLCWLVFAKIRGAENLDLLIDIYKYMPKPDINFHMMLSPREALLRLNIRGTSNDLKENDSFLTKANNIYSTMINDYYENTVVIDASLSIDEIHLIIKEHLRERKGMNI